MSLIIDTKDAKNRSKRIKDLEERICNCGFLTESIFDQTYLKKYGECYDCTENITLRSKREIIILKEIK